MHVFVKKKHADINIFLRRMPCLYRPVQVARLLLPFPASLLPSKAE
jgi:hypothetical protein